MKGASAISRWSRQVWPSRHLSHQFTQLFFCLSFPLLPTNHYSASPPLFPDIPNTRAFVINNSWASPLAEHPVAPLLQSHTLLSLLKPPPPPPFLLEPFPFTARSTFLEEMCVKSWLQLLSCHYFYQKISWIRLTGSCSYRPGDARLLGKTHTQKNGGREANGDKGGNDENSARYTETDSKTDTDRHRQTDTDRDRQKARQRETVRQNRVIDFSHSFFMGGEQLWKFLLSKILWCLFYVTGMQSERRVFFPELIYYDRFLFYFI